ncbi:protein of unknown function DUF411 (plasmid) [Stanieria cyanosphaera PCC 7437]|uniref:Metal-binding protein n=1 Tax=Stanieria cyanosphaera (strain ATCC 29371 / PCC 7437) TaxID=111780 RepID=K9XZE2_STAC7|nr:DUF411 domain-containing protein [Stanieria cyanosphaera]AFZ37965.1 protein of unknown function DUF411 [Stanieria cyanosphaera PCC 7437]
MSKLLSKITITSIAIASALGGAYYLTSSQGVNQTLSDNNSVVAQNINTATLVSVWDRETEPDFSGTRKMTVYRSPSCGCCGIWVEHAEKHGFKIEDIKTEEMEALKQKHNVPAELASCHTTIIDGYVMEGHIPADDIKRFLAEKPDDLIGLAVPGMPIGTPGMEAKDIKQPFQVLAFNDKGEVKVFKEYQSY